MLPSWLTGWLFRLRSRQLFLLAGGLFVADLLIPDPIPLVDEMMFGLTTLLLARWKRRKTDP
ncbi:MAG TPA: hypothetical protein DIU48_12435 [Acidobacteria bacterium]|jgi:hypothetical protein|nr:hypothetical protein [Acidobacteriota bacterium]|tara:strand:- start:394 stop:579 length:186 start_codon:yes stop_codon:yes gene_type:complete